MNKIFILFLFITIFSSISFAEIYACPRCNEDFKKELMDKRANTLGGQELLEAIKNQDGANSVVLPKNYVKPEEPLSEGMKQILTGNENEVKSLSTFELIKLFITTWVFRS